MKTITFLYIDKRNAKHTFKIDSDDSILKIGTQISPQTIGLTNRQFFDKLGRGFYPRTDYLNPMIEVIDIEQKKFLAVDSTQKTIVSYKNEQEVEFPNGFTSWHETHFEVVSNIFVFTSWDSIIQPEKLRSINEKEGHTGLYNLAKELTDKFEEKNKGRKWNGEFYDEVEEFVKQEIQ